MEQKHAEAQKAMELLVFEQHKADAARLAAAAAANSKAPPVSKVNYSKFHVANGTQGFHELTSILGDLRLPLLKAIQSADGLHKSMVFLPTAQLKEVLSFLDMLSSLTSAASCSVSVTGNETLPPYPALGLTWMMHALNQPFPTLSKIQALHQLATSAVSPATAQILVDTSHSHTILPKWPTGSLPVPLSSSPVAPPSGLGIAPKANILIKPRALVLLSQSSIKDHPQKPKIIALTKTLYDSNLPKSCQAQSGKDYLCQALKIVDPASQGNVAQHSISFTDAQGCTSRFLASSQDLFGPSPRLPISQHSFTQVTKTPAQTSTEWTTVARRPKAKATIQGTKINTVTATVPNGFHVPYPSLGVNGPELTEHIQDALHAHPGVLPLLANNAFQKVVWSNNRKRLEISYQFPLDWQLKLVFHSVLAAFFGAPVDDTKFIEQPMISSIKWLAVPQLDTNGQVISEDALHAQITASGLLSKANIVQGPM